MKTKTSERAIGRQIRIMCTERKYRIVKLIPAQHNGLPDREIYLRNGHKMHIELKSEGESRTPMQERWGEWLVDNKHLYICIDRIDDEVINVLTRIFDLLDNSDNGSVPQEVYTLIDKITVPLKFTYS